MDQYKILGRVGEGAHGVVFKGKHIPSGDLVALKKVLLKKIEEGIPNTALREMKALQEIEDHENIIKLREVIPQGMGFMLVFEFMFSDLSEVIKNYVQPLTQAQIKRYMVMLLKGVAFCHSIKIMHRDLKPANLLISSTGVLKIADFGLARVFDAGKNRPYSHQVATRWYRAPELLFSARKYDEGVDLWAVGCIFGEMINSSPLFHGDSDIEQICCVLKVLGEPNEQLWPDLSDLPDFNKISFPHFAGIPFNQLLPEASNQAISLIQWSVFTTHIRSSNQYSLIDLKLLPILLIIVY